MENKDLTRDEDRIRDQMTETRTSLSEKLEKLEEQVAGTVTGATDTVKGTVEAVKETVADAKDAVTGTVDAVKETVEAVKDSVQETIGAVKDTVQSTVQTVKDTVKGGVDYMKDLLDIPRQTRRHPWIALGAAVASGFCLGRLLGGKSSKTADIPTTMSVAANRPPRCRPRAGNRRPATAGTRKPSPRASSAAWPASSPLSFSSLRAWPSGC